MKDRNALQNRELTTTQAEITRSRAGLMERGHDLQPSIGGHAEERKDNNQWAKASADVKFQKLVTINQPISEVYAFWRNLENLPSFMKHLVSVTVMDEQTSYWVLRSSENHLWAWGVELTETREDEIISWRSIDDAGIQTAGSVSFSTAPDDHSTTVNLTLNFSSPPDKFMVTMVKFLEQDMQMTIGEDLSRLKTLLESTGAPIITEQPCQPRKQIYGSVMPFGRLRL